MFFVYFLSIKGGTSEQSFDDENLRTLARLPSTVSPRQLVASMVGPSRWLLPVQSDASSLPSHFQPNLG